MAPTNTFTVLEHCQVAPPPGSVAAASLPLISGDIHWIGFSPIQRLLFYHHPISKSDFVAKIIPNLKNSLSLTLQHFWALAANLIVPSDLSIPEIRYDDGDSSVSLLFAESSFRDFDYLIGNQPRNCNEFYPLVAQLPKSRESSGSIIVPLVSLQVTLFPEIGICIGITNDHAAGDGSSIFSFMKAWANFSKQGEDAAVSSVNKYLPFYDRSVMPDTKESIESNWSRKKDGIKNKLLSQYQELPMDTDKVRATFVVGKEDVQRLKSYVSSKLPVKHLSTFTVVCAYVWSCLVKSRDGNLENEELEMESIIFPVDCRGRSDPPIPANYFGNCLSACLASTKNGQLAGEEGFLNAAELIGGAIHRRLVQEGVFGGMDTFFAELSKVNMKRLLSLAGSPKHDYYNMDLGWGKPKKFEFVSIDSTGAISLSENGDKGGLEVGLSLPKERMDAFIGFFEEGFKRL